MQISLVAVGRKAPAWINEGFESYRKRITTPCRLQLIEVESVRRTPALNTSKMLSLEADRIRAALPKGARVIALDERGREFSTRDLAGRIAEWANMGQDVACVIGGADGLEREFIAAADETWSLSCMTLPHALARVLLAEQIYRACSILMNHPYHRE
ncbi:MAG TPA: 23S rRNA (pseudouridine(1915)-N(3))-methyltransferase RlmH [Gammaproteobacteria bacterium]|nr:23S rRNA (pseudouridine(1915)-N(3))-methyltransferase RlmH [Gammaproteobacteria bacterium]